MFRTRKNQEIRPTNYDGTFVRRRADNGGDYALVQIMPPVPQRFEWILESRIREVKS